MQNIEFEEESSESHITNEVSILEITAEKEENNYEFNGSITTSGEPIFENNDEVSHQNEIDNHENDVV